MPVVIPFASTRFDLTIEMRVSMTEIFRPAVNLETQTNRKDTEYTKKVQVGPFFGKNLLGQKKI